jgi:5-methylcytosine-specific restriction protein A
MPKLAAPPPRLKTMAPRIGYAKDDQEATDRHRNNNSPFRAWYKTARWQRLRDMVIKRDLYTCQQTGVLLTGKHPAPNSPVVDHIKRHNGDPELFWDPTNLQTVSKEFHDSTKQSLERRGLA